jgi:hypothetical protein
MSQFAILELWHQPALEFKAIAGKRRKRHWSTGRVIRKLVFLTIMAQPKAAGWVRKVAGKAIAFQQHAFRHLFPPGLHYPADDAKRNASPAQMSCQGKSIWTGTYDGGICLLHFERLVPSDHEQSIKLV